MSIVPNVSSVSLIKELLAVYPEFEEGVVDCYGLPLTRFADKARLVPTEGVEALFVICTGVGNVVTLHSTKTPLKL